RTDRLDGPRATETYPMKRTYYLAGVVPLLLLALLVGCRGKDDSSTAPTLEVGIFTWVGYAPMHLAKEKGYFEDVNVKLSSIEAKPVNEAEIAANTFTSGDVDAAVTWEPYLSKAARKAGSHILVTSKDTPGLIVDVFTVRDDYLRKHPDAVKGFIRGWYRAVK